VLVENRCQLVFQVVVLDLKKFFRQLLQKSLVQLMLCWSVHNFFDSCGWFLENFFHLVPACAVLRLFSRGRRFGLSTGSFRLWGTLFN
jgi:hypothetical protein